MDPAVLRALSTLTFGSGAQPDCSLPGDLSARWHRSERQCAPDVASRQQADELLASLGVILVPTVPLERDPFAVG